MQQAGYLASPGPLDRDADQRRRTPSPAWHWANSRSSRSAAKVSTTSTIAAFSTSNDPPPLRLDRRPVQWLIAGRRHDHTDSNGNYPSQTSGPGRIPLPTSSNRDMSRPRRTLGGSFRHNHQRDEHLRRKFRHHSGRSALRHGVSRHAVEPAVGRSLVVSWDDTNGGNSPITASFTDHVTITNSSQARFSAWPMFSTM